MMKAAEFQTAPGPAVAPRVAVEANRNLSRPGLQKSGPHAPFRKFPRTGLARWYGGPGVADIVYQKNLVPRALPGNFPVRDRPAADTASASCVRVVRAHYACPRVSDG